MPVHFTIGFNQEEKQELLNIFANHPKYLERVNNSIITQPFQLIDNGNLPSVIKTYGHLENLNGVPWFAKPLPEKLDIGKTAIIKSGHTWEGRIGRVETHYINCDHCGDWGAHTYMISGYDGERYTTRTENCEILK